MERARSRLTLAAAAAAAAALAGVAAALAVRSPDAPDAPAVLGRGFALVARGVVPWANAHLPIERGAHARTIAGMSAGGYGAVDIALRHPGLFDAVESWSGYYRPLRDGSLARAGRRTLAAHDPLRLVRR